MGTLFYGSARTAVTIDDRLLAHLRVVAVAKLRRNEPFLISWVDASEIGGGRSSIWVHPACDLHFKFDGGRPATIDQSLLEELSLASAQSRGIELDGVTLRTSPATRPLG